MIQVFPVCDPGLGNTAHVVDLGDRSALVIDPERDPRPYLEIAGANGLKIRHVAETHLHADFVSGARELVALGATLIAPRRGVLSHPHRAVEEGDELAVGDLSLTALDTPGHTPEHVAYLLSDGSEPQVLFSGGTLMIGGVARPDLLSSEETLPLARRAYQSIRHVLGILPDDVEVRPTHGAGSFCSPVDAGEATSSTIKSERSSHPAMTIDSEDEFVDALLAGLGSYPPYFLRLRDVNRTGPTVYGTDLPRLRTVNVDELDQALVIDVRPIDRFAKGHVPGSLSIELRGQFGTWLGWLVTPETKIVFVVDPDQDERELVRQTLNVGHENIVGRTDLADRVASGNELESIELVGADDIDPSATILDVRQGSEWDMGHVSGAVHAEVGELADGAPPIDAGTVVHCGHGQRAMTAASLLMRAGRPPTAVATADYREIERAIAGQWSVS